ncbi:MAG: hypothetical protein AAFU80_18170 [Pseudomonadota bacterium]
MRIALIALATFLPWLAHAQGVRATDETFTAAALADELGGSALEFFDGSRADYAADTGYTFRYQPEGRVWRGAWATNEDSAVCIAFDNGFSRCDTIVRAGERLVLITEDGLRFPVRVVHSLAP